jgi:hypothetical protein
MGMFDNIRNHYPIGPGYDTKMLQTKDLSCMMEMYWLDPVGQLWLMSHEGTHDFHEDETSPLGFKWIPNGNHGRLIPYLHTGSITVYPSTWDCKYAPFPECKLLFREGVLEVVTHIHKSNH